MMHHEFCAITNTQTSFDQYINEIEPLYMQSPLPKQEFCKLWQVYNNDNIHTEYSTMKLKPIAELKSSVKNGLKLWLKLWFENDIDEDIFFSVKYLDGEVKIISSDTYNGEKIRMQGIENICCLTCGDMSDFYFRDIMTKETVEFFITVGIGEYDFETRNKASNRKLIVDDLEEDYWKQFE